MINATIYSETISAGQTSRRLFSGAYFKLISATGTVNVRTDVVALSAISSGQGFEKAPFTFLELTDASGAANTIRYVVATEGFLDGIQGTIQVSASVIPKLAGLTNVNNTVTSASAQLLAANGARQYLLIQNKDASGFVYVNFGAAATIANGIRIGPGENFELSAAVSTQSVFAIGDIASNTNVLTVQG